MRLVAHCPRNFHNWTNCLPFFPTFRQLIRPGPTALASHDQNHPGMQSSRRSEEKELEYLPNVSQTISTQSKSKSARFFSCALLCAVTSLAPVSAMGHVKSHQHSITVKFNYDFGLTPGCALGAKKDCVQEFVVYDISAGPANRQRLASKPVDSGTTGRVEGISITSPRLPFEIGKHLIAVVARAPDGTESDLYKCTIWLHFR
jgi:hypothetical protein